MKATYGKYKLRKCHSLHHCEICDEDITHGEQYHDGGYGKRAHKDCVDPPPMIHVITNGPPPDDRDWNNQCARCGSSMHWERCDNCEDGYDGHDCGEDCCCCLYPEENVRCDTCLGECGWHVCLSSPERCESNPLPGRENVQRGQVEWSTFDVPDPALFSESG